VAVTNQRRASELDAVALLADRPAEKLIRGQVGTVVEHIDEHTTLVEFNDDEGRGYVVAPFTMTELLVLHYEPRELSPPAVSAP
jgi:Domain of unknown function (DUF4926)